MPRKAGKYKTGVKKHDLIEMHSAMLEAVHSPRMLHFKGMDFAERVAGECHAVSHPILERLGHAIDEATFYVNDGSPESEENVEKVGSLINRAVELGLVEE